MSTGMLDAGGSGGGGGSLDASEDPWSEDSGSSSSDERDSVTVVESSPYRSSDAESQVQNADGGDRESTTVTDAAPNRLSEGASAVLDGASSTDGYGPEETNQTTENINEIDGATNYDATATDADEGGFGASPGTPGYSAVADPETDTQRDATGSATIETGDSNDLTQEVANDFDDAWNDVEETADNVAENASQAASNAADEATDLVDLTAKQKLALGIVLLGAAGIVFRPYASMGASAAEAAS